MKNASYLPLGPIAGWTYGNGRVLTRAYDQDYRPKAIQDTSAGGLDVGFGFDPVGNLSKLTPAGGTVAEVTLGYDPLGRLTEFKDGVTGTVLDGYTYDKTGNRQSSKSAAGEVAYTYEANSHRLIKVGGAPRVYNAVGDTTSINGTEREFVYDVTGRMSQVKRNGVVVREYRYNGKGEQVRRFLGTANTYTLYDESGHWMGDYDNAGKPLQQAIWLDDMPVGVTGADAKLAYIEPDHLGSPRVVIDPARNTAVWAWNLKSEAFGLTNPDQDADKDGSNFLLNMRFPGQRYDSFSGLNQNYYREYDTSSGRYTQSDPIGQGGGLNLYGYVKNAPYSWKDVDGQQAISLSANPAITGATALSGHALQNPSELTVDGSFGDYRGNPLSPVFDLVHLMASPGNQADSGVVQIVSRIQSDAVLAGRKRPDRCEVLQQLIDSGVIPAKAAKATQKAWGCRPSRISKDRC